MKNVIENECDECSMKVSPLYLIAALGVGLFGGSILGGMALVEGMQKEAIKSGVAHWQTNTNTGEAVFTYRKGCQ